MLPPHCRQSTPFNRDFPAIGIDFGGTSIKVGLVARQEILAKTQLVTNSFETPSKAFEAARDFVVGVIESHAGSLGGNMILEDLPVGIAMAGVFDKHHGTLLESANLSRWIGRNISAEARPVFRTAPRIINDANAAALAQFAAGSQAATSLVLVTLGTGIGSGIVIDGKPVEGFNCCGGEIGHLTIDYSQSARHCGCGGRGHLEAYAGAAGVVATMQELILNSAKNDNLGNSDQMTPHAIAAAAESGDDLAIQAIEFTGLQLGKAIVALAHVVDPEIVALGGAMTFGGAHTKAGRTLLTAVQNQVRESSLQQISRNITIQFATLGNEAGMIGAALHALMCHEATNSDAEYQDIFTR